MQLIDTHCHLVHERLRKDQEAVLARAAQAGVETLVCAVGDINEAIAAHDLALRHANVFCLAGVHPHEARGADDGYTASLVQLAMEPRCVAIGEIGLDYHYDFSPRDVQRRVFDEQLDLARRMGKPVVIHTREAFEDTRTILKESGADAGRVVFHSFTEDADAAGILLDLGCWISFSGIVTFKNADALREAARIVPADRILTETDAPYLSPEPVRRMKTNEPANVAHVARFLAQLRGVDEEEFARTTTDNARRFFGLPAPHSAAEP